jgi:hypothetical protein
MIINEKYVEYFLFLLIYKIYMSLNARNSTGYMNNVSKAFPASTGFTSSPVPVPAPTSFANKTSAMAANLFAQAKGKLSGKSGIIILSLFFLLLFVAVIVYIIREIKGNKYEVGKTVTKDIIRLSEMDAPLEIPGNEFKEHKPREYSYSFWLYVDGFTQTPGYGKIVFHRGERESVQTANPIVMMDEFTNQLHFVIRTEGSTLASSDESIDYRKLKPILERNYFLNKDLKLTEANINKHLVLSVDSVPRQTWMHYALVVKNNMVTLYQNGEYYITKSVNDFMRSKHPEVNQKGEPIKYDLVVDKTAGSLFVGRNSAIGGRNAVNGYLSKMEFFTNALNISDVNNIYKRGPIQSNWLQKLGITGYGVRTPVFKLNAQV